MSAAPYPTDTRAKGWRFELNYEQIEQSDTWDLAAEIPLAQHALLMMWFIAWKQEPCGSLPDDEVVIRSKCRIPAKQWTQMREVLMRGWWLADDGRLYHPTITARVMEMMARRRSDSDRQAKRRAKESQDSHADEAHASRVTNDGLGRESSTGTGTDVNHSVTSLRLVTGGKPPEKSTEQMTKDELWAAGKSLLMQAGTPHAQCGAIVGKLVKTYGDTVVVEAVRSAVVERPADPVSFLTACCQRIKGERGGQSGIRSIATAADFAGKPTVSDGAGRPIDVSGESLEGML